MMAASAVAATQTISATTIQHGGKKSAGSTNLPAEKLKVGKKGLTDQYSLWQFMR